MEAANPASEKTSPTHAPDAPTVMAEPPPPPLAVPQKYIAPPPREEVPLTRADSAWEAVEPEWHVQYNETIAHKIHRFLIATAVPSSIVIAGLLLLQFIDARIEAHVVGRVIAGYCTLLSVVMTVLLIQLHLMAYTNPEQQRRIIRILAMIPIYAIDSLIALWNPHFAEFFDLARDCYESYVIFNFYSLLMDYLGGEEAAIQFKTKDTVKCMAPLCCLGSFSLNRRTLRIWKVLLVQYMLVKPLCTVVAIYLSFQGRYDERSWSFSNSHVWIVLIVNGSVTVAFTVLVYLFMEYRTQLAAYEPLGKFAAVKAVVFLTFWQGIVLGCLAYFDIIQGSREGMWTKEEVSTGVQDFLVCVEMMVMCYVHHNVFPETPYVPLSGHTPIQSWKILHVLGLRDVLTDTTTAMKDTALMVQVQVLRSGKSE